MHGDKLESTPYWAISFPAAGAEKCQSLEENAERLRACLINAARLRFLRSDVPVGAYLSGGIDSSVTAAIIARYTDVPLKTFSLQFIDTEFDEGRYQREMMERLGTDHQIVLVSASDIGNVFPDVIWHAERPILRTAPAPLFLLSKLVRQSGYKVVVTGEGADEVLAGYDIFQEGKVRLFWSRDSDSEKRWRIVSLLYPWMERSPGNAPSFARAFFSRNLDPSDPAVSHRPRWDSTKGIISMLTAGARTLMEGRDVEDDLIRRMPAGCAEWDSLGRAQWLEMTTLLPGYILSAQGDRMLMAHSVEGRFPFLDPDLVSLAGSLPARHKLLGLDEKHILKRAFADLVPQSILKRPKQPYRAPDASSFFSGSNADWVNDVVSPEALQSAGVFEPSLVGRLVEKCRKTQGERMSNTDNMRVLAVLSTMLTHQMFIAADGRGSQDEEPPQPMMVIDTLGTIGTKGA
jgi:asparagine synthase (glutamine-hydrolysing)